MHGVALKTGRTLVFVIAGILASGPAFADKPSWAGGGKDEKREQKDRPEKQKKPSHDKEKPETRTGGHFGERHRVVVRGYYEEQFRAGRCPPGLAKKRNGCMPPGQARKWAVGRPLPREVIYYELPPAVIVQLGPPPAEHRYVRVATDILLIAVGTGMVVDALQDLGGM